MYGRFTRNTTLITAHSTIGQRATNRIAPRHDKRRPDGMCQGRVQIQTIVLTTPIGSQWNKYGRSSTLVGCWCVSSANGGIKDIMSSASEDSGYQDSANKNCIACLKPSRDTTCGA